MLTILIADDEKKVGLLVRELIDWERLPLQLVDIVQDGKTAYDVIMEKKPDIVITDIRMPNISGLEMIQKVTEAGEKIHFIVISGFRYFEYAQTALKYGVEDYLLKPIDEEELNRILEKVCEEESSRKKESKRVEQIQNCLNSSKYVRHRELINCMICRNELSPMEEINKDYGVNLNAGIFRGIQIKVDRNIKTDRNEPQERLVMQKLMQLAEKEFEGKVMDIVLSVQESMGMLVLLNYTEEKRTEIQECTNQMFLHMKDYINDFINYEITMGISRETGDFSQTNLILEMAREAINSRIYQGTGRRIEDYSENRNRRMKAKDIAVKYEEELSKAIAIMEWKKIAEYVRQCFAEAEREQVMACEFYEMAKELITFFCGNAAELFGEETHKENKCWVDTANHCKSVVMLEKYLCNVFKEYLEALYIKRKESESRPIQEAAEYIKKNYSQRILLEEMAERFGFNANYFSEIFKNEMGKNFSVYLLEVRMEEAKTLLRDTKDTVYEIAAKVGYKDAKFFSQQFIKTVGIRPNEYRKLYY